MAVLLFIWAMIKQMHVCTNLLVKVNMTRSKGTANSALLEKGTLYAANMGSGKWVALTVDAVRKAAESKKNTAALEKFKTQADVLVYTHEAAILLGCNTNRPSGRC